MKKSPVYIVILTYLFFSLYSNSLQAQFLKKIINTVKNTANNRANDQAAQSTNKAIDKAANTTKTKTNNSSDEAGDSSSTNEVLGAFAKAAQDNPNDTSAADLTMKGLGNLIGGGGVSSEDSAAAIKSFMSSSGGSGYYYETTNTVTTERGTAKSINKFWFTKSGEGRVEMNLAGMMGMSGGSPMIGISRADKPGYSAILDDGDKTYSLSIVNMAFVNKHDGKYKVTKIGNETVNGYPCVHAKLTSSGRNKMDMDIWTCKSVPGYAQMEEVMTNSKSVASPGMLNALKQAGADGYFVKMVIKNKDISSETILTKVEQKNLPASLFTIPSGYSQSSYGVMGNLLKNAQKQK
ncbi:MAG: DUF4412 domain-containing protein [Ginsengibacter sp.]